MSRLCLPGPLVLCLTAIAVLMLGTGLARGEAGAKWTVNGTNAASLNASAKAEDANPGLLTQIAKVFVYIKCTHGESLEAKLIGEGKLNPGLKGKFTGCTTYLNSVLSKACTPNSAGAPSGTIETAKAKGLIVLHELGGGVKDTILNITPEIGTTYATLLFGEECAIGEKIPVIGRFSLKDAEFGVQKEAHFLTVGPLTEMWVISETFEHAVTFHALATSFLTGSHGGLQWSATPG